MWDSYKWTKQWYGKLFVTVTPDFSFFSESSQVGFDQPVQFITSMFYENSSNFLPRVRALQAR